MSDIDLQEMKSDIKQIKKAVYGNGEKGLAEQVRENSRAICRHIEYCEKHRRVFGTRIYELFSIIFKASVGLVLGYIAYKVGI